MSVLTFVYCLLWASDQGVLVWDKVDFIIIISLKINLFMPWYRYKIAELVLNNNHSITRS
jgi:hypothetical protein